MTDKHVPTENKKLDENLENKKQENESGDDSGPVETLKFGRVRCTVWKNTGSDGEQYHSFNVHRVYTTDDGESFEQTSSFGVGDLGDLLGLAVKLSVRYGVEVF